MTASTDFGGWGGDFAPTRKARLSRRAHRKHALSRRMNIEWLEDRRLLSFVSSGDDTNAPPFSAGEILIGFDGDLPALYRNRGAAVALEAAGKLVGANGLHSPKVLMDLPAGSGRGARLATVWQLPAGTDVLQTVQQFTGRPGIAYAEPNYAFSIDATPNDPRFSELWGLNNTRQTGGTLDADIDAPEAWGIATGSGKVVVGVIDTGVDYTHADLAANMWVNPGEIPEDGIDNDGNGYADDVYGWDFVNDDNDPFDDNGHGTHVSGTIAAEGDNATGVVGVNWSAQVMALKFLDSAGNGTTADAVAAVSYATMMHDDFGINVCVTSSSWGGGSFSQALEDAIGASGAAGMLFVAAAGNNGSDSDASPYYPASYTLENIISVAATDHNDAKASFSNYGATSVDLAAPGVGILSTTPGNTYGLKDGTSMATPHVAGVAALAWSTASGATAALIKEAILDGADSIAAMAGISVTGGRLNAYGTLQRVGMTVSGSSPDDGEIVATRPTDFVIHFSLPIDSTTLHAADLQVNGLPANNYTFHDASPNTVIFHYGASPVQMEGLQTMHLAAASVETTSDVPLDQSLREWNATFRYDTRRLQVASTTPVDGSTVELPFTSLKVTFNEPYAVGTVGTEDLLVSQGEVTAATPVDGDAQSVIYTLTGIIKEGTFSIVMPAGR